jgi:hypothetical protein
VTRAEEVAAFLDGLAARAVVVSVGPRGGILAPGAERHERAFIRANKAGVLAELRRRGRAATRAARPAAGKSPRRAPEPEPVVFAWPGRRVTDADVLECLRGAGDQALTDYRSGELPKADAYDMTKHWLRERLEMRRLFAAR